MGNKIISPVNGVLFLDMVPLTAFIITAVTGTPINSGQLLGALLVGSSLLINNLYQRKWNSMLRTYLAKSTETETAS
jgi:drug/metabolite transporter (DMT)-like permease